MHLSHSSADSGPLMSLASKREKKHSSACWAFILGAAQSLEHSAAIACQHGLAANDLSTRAGLGVPAERGLTQVKNMLHVANRACDCFHFWFYSPTSPYAGDGLPTSSGTLAMRQQNSTGAPRRFQQRQGLSRSVGAILKVLTSAFPDPSREIVCLPVQVGVPERTFGTQLVEDSEWERPEVLPFSTYAACRILDTTPDSDVSCRLFPHHC